MIKRTVERCQGITVLKIEGAVDLGAGDVQLRDFIREAFEDGANLLAVDFSKVTAMDSAGIGELVRLYTTYREQGKELCLLHLNEKMYDLMTLTRLITVFQIFDSVEDAASTLRVAA